jgi:hypothetical protein
VRELGSTNEVSLASEARHQVEFLRTGQAPQLVLAFPGRSDWSAPFKLQDIGQNYVRVPIGKNEERLARIDAVLEGPCIFIRIDPEQGAWPFLLRNDSDFLIEFEQAVRFPFLLLFLPLLQTLTFHSYRNRRASPSMRNDRLVSATNSSRGRSSPTLGTCPPTRIANSASSLATESASSTLSRSVPSSPSASTTEAIRRSSPSTFELRVRRRLSPSATTSRRTVCSSFSDATPRLPSVKNRSRAVERASSRLSTRTLQLLSLSASLSKALVSRSSTATCRSSSTPRSVASRPSTPTRRTTSRTIWASSGSRSTTSSSAVSTPSSSTRQSSRRTVRSSRFTRVCRPLQSSSRTKASHPLSPRRPPFFD